jgi:hypothetical protein
VFNYKLIRLKIHLANYFCNCVFCFVNSLYLILHVYVQTFDVTKVKVYCDKLNVALMLLFLVRDLCLAGFLGSDLGGWGFPPKGPYQRACCSTKKYFYFHLISQKKDMISYG